MQNLADHLREKNPNGIPYSDAAKLFLWLYSSSDFIPNKFKNQTFGRSELVSVFLQLESENVIVNPLRLGGEAALRSEYWSSLIDDLLKGNICLDMSFPSKISKYI